jgi:hypothetical protein
MSVIIAPIVVEQATIISDSSNAIGKIITKASDKININVPMQHI